VILLGLFVILAQPFCDFTSHFVILLSHFMILLSHFAKSFVILLGHL
jgi:hypothetical protein